MKISTCLIDGFGNNLFQLSFIYQYAKKHQIEHLISVRLWDNIIFGQPAFGGHPRMSERTIGDIFPDIPYESDSKSLDDLDVCLTYAKQDSGFHNWSLEQLLSKCDIYTNYIVFSGWFFHYKYHEDYRIDWINWMRFSDKLDILIPKLDYTKTISLHSRLGSLADTSSCDPIYIAPTKVLKTLEKIRQEFPEMTTLLVCSENKERFEKYILVDKIIELGYNYVFLDADIEICLYASIQCAHHLLANSTLSYMIAYMDKKFPEKSVAYYDNFNYLVEPVISPSLKSGFRKYES